MLPCRRPAFSATLSRAVPSSFRQHRSRLRRSSTSCAGGNPLLLPLRLQPLSLLVAVGAHLWPPPLPRRGSSLPPCGVVEPVTDRTPSPSRPPPDPAATHCQEFYSLTEATLGTDALAHSWPRGLRKYAFPPVSLLAQTLCKIREDEEQVLLVAPYWPNRTWFPELMLHATVTPWPIPLRKDLLSQRRGTLWHPRPDLWKLHVWSLDGMGGSTHYHFSTGTVHETGLYSEVEPVRRMVFLPPGGPPEMLDQSCAFLFTARVGA